MTQIEPISSIARKIDAINRLTCNPEHFELMRESLLTYVHIKEINEEHIQQLTKKNKVDNERIRQLTEKNALLSDKVQKLETFVALLEGSHGFSTK